MLGSSLGKQAENEPEAKVVAAARLVPVGPWLRPSNDLVCFSLHFPNLLLEREAAVSGLFYLPPSTIALACIHFLALTLWKVAETDGSTVALWLITPGSEKDMGRGGGLTCNKVSS